MRIKSKSLARFASACLRRGQIERLDRAADRLFTVAVVGPNSVQHKAFLAGCYVLDMAILGRAMGGDSPASSVRYSAARASESLAKYRGHP